MPAKLPWGRQAWPRLQGAKGLASVAAPPPCVYQLLAREPLATAILQWKHESLLISEVPGTKTEQSIPFGKGQTLKMEKLHWLPRWLS